MYVHTYYKIIIYILFVIVLSVHHSVLRKDILLWSNRQISLDKQQKCRKFLDQLSNMLNLQLCFLFERDFFCRFCVNYMTLYAMKRVN